MASMEEYIKKLEAEKAGILYCTSFHGSTFVPLLLDYNKKYLLLETHLYHSCFDPDCLPHINEELDINHSVFVMRDTVIALKVHWTSNP